MTKTNVNDIQPTQWTPSLLRLGAAACVLVVAAVALRSLQMERRSSEDLVHAVEKNFGVLFSAFCFLGFAAVCIKSTVFFLKKDKTIDGLELKRLNHTKLLSLLTKLYPDFKLDGLCRGYALTGLDDLLEGSSSFRDTLKKLDSLSYLREEDLIAKIKEDKDLSNFFDKLQSEYFNRKRDTLIGGISGVYQEPKDLLPLMLDFQEQLNSASIPFKALAFLIASREHNIAVVFNSEENVYRLIDANHLNSNIFPLESISKKIAASYNFPGESKAFCIDVFLSTGEENKLDPQSVFNAWKTSILSQQTQSLSSLSENEKFNWLYHAASANDKQSVLSLVSAGVNVNQTIKNGSTPLYAACEKGHEEVVKILIDTEFDVHQGRKNGSTSLHAAASDGNEKIVKILIDKGFEVNQTDEDGVTPLHRACQNGNEKAVKVLIDNGSNINQKK